MAQIKGFVIRGLLKYVKQSGHPGGIPGILDKLPEALRPTFKLKILNGSWYPYDAYAGLLEVVDREIGDGELSIMPEIGRFAARQEAGSIWKLVTYFSSVETLLQRSTLFWPRYCDQGIFETRDVQEGRGTGILRDFPGVSRGHCHLLCGWVDQMARNAGAKTVETVKTQCIHRGDEWCQYEGGWTS